MIYFLSDAHIGSRALPDRQEHEREVCALLRRLAADAAQLYLLGDIFDFWYEFAFGDEEEYSLTLDTLRDITRSGVEVHFFTGNHDLWTFGRLARRTGVIVHTGPAVAVLNGRRCFLAHGDGLVPSDMHKRYPKHVRRKIRRFMRLRRVFHNPVLQHLFRLMPPVWGNAFGYGWAKKSRLKELAHPAAYKGEREEELVLFAKEMERKEHFDYYIFGHRHIELDLELAAVHQGGPAARVLVLGDLFRQWTYAAMDDDGRLALLNAEHGEDNLMD